MAIEGLESFIQKSHKEKEITWPYGLETELSFDGNRLKTAIKLANKRVYKAADNREDYTGMGTTVVAALVRATCHHRIGRRQPLLPLPGRHLTQLTRDDSWVSAAWTEGILTSDEIDKHPLRNVITKAWGPRTASRSTSWSTAGSRRRDHALLGRPARHDERRQHPGRRHALPGRLEKARPS
jgi:serine/threonine protein phosphatase PrpC